jgi:putative restriction endonuclease
MKYWWVNQKQTYAQEKAGGYIWSPQKGAGGRRIQFYENMREVSPGDIVFSYVSGFVVSVGIIQTTGYDASKPTDFGAAGTEWSFDGWCVDVEYHEIDNRLNPRDHIDHIRPLLPDMYSPLQANGNGNQVYLCAISKELGAYLVELIGQEAIEVLASIDNIAMGQKSIEDIESKIQSDNTIPETEKHQLVKSRIGQGLFRSRVESIEKACRLTGVTQKNHLIASHIKPWAISNNSERLDGNNGLLLAPHVDHLFDKGYISFEDSGDIIVSPRLDYSVMTSWGLLLKNAGLFSHSQSIYLAYHRENILKW